MALTIPGPIESKGDFLYQLNVAPGNTETILWGGYFTAHNSSGELHLDKAVKLFLAAEDMLAALIAARDAWGDTEFPSVMVNAAIAKATSTT